MSTEADVAPPSGAKKSRRKPKPKPAPRTPADALAEEIIENLHHFQGKLPRHANRHDWYKALAYTIRNRVMDLYIARVDAVTRTDTSAKVVA